MSKKKIIGLIPARWGSTRFPGKPLALINGKTMISHVYERCSLCKDLDQTFVVTDNDEIISECESNNMNSILIKEECNTGTDRIALASKDLEADIFVNIQGDEPLIDPEGISKVIQSLVKEDDNVVASNAYTLIKEPYKVVDSDVVKVAFDKNEHAMFFSRSPIPNPKASNTIFYQQLGLYAFKKESLEKFSSLRQGLLEMSEGVEMFRFIENGFNLKMVKVEDVGLSVDSPKDIKTIEDFLKNQ